MAEINEVFDARIDRPRVVDADIVHAFVRHFPQDDAGDARRLQRFHVLHIAHVQPDEDEPADALLVETPHGEAFLLRRELRQGHLARIVPLRARFLDRHQVHAERRVGRGRQEDADGVRAPFGEGTRRRVVDVIERFRGGPDLADRFRGRFVRLAEGAGYGRKRDVRFDGNVFYGRPSVIETVFIHFIISFQCIIHLFCTSMSTFSI